MVDHSILIKELIECQKQASDPEAYGRCLGKTLAKHGVYPIIVHVSKCDTCAYRDQCGVLYHLDWFSRLLQQAYGGSEIKLSVSECKMYKPEDCAQKPARRSIPPTLV